MKKMLPIMQAYADGKVIQWEDGYGWHDINNIIDGAMLDMYPWRIKPEPKYRPFKDEEECFFEMKKHKPFGWIKIDETYKSIASLQEKYLYLNGENSLRHYFTLFRDATFADGTPFGIKEGGEE